MEISTSLDLSKCIKHDSSILHVLKSMNQIHFQLVEFIKDTDTLYITKVTNEVDEISILKALGCKINVSYLFDQDTWDEKLVKQYMKEISYDTIIACYRPYLVDVLRMSNCNRLVYIYYDKTVTISYEEKTKVLDYIYSNFNTCSTMDMTLGRKMMFCIRKNDESFFNINMIEIYSKKNAEQDLEISNLKDHIKQIKVDIENKQKQIEDINVKIENKQFEEVKQDNKEIDVMKRIYNDKQLQLDFNELKLQIGNHDSYIKSLEDRFEKNIDTTEYLQETFEELKVDHSHILTDLTEKIENIEETINSLDIRILQLESDVSKLKMNKSDESTDESDEPANEFVYVKKN